MEGGAFQNGKRMIKQKKRCKESIVDLGKRIERGVCTTLNSISPKREKKKKGQKRKKTGEEKGEAH